MKASPETRGSKPQVFFIHIEKTAGSSLIDWLILPNVADNHRIGSLKSYLPVRNTDCVHGHAPYGYHVVAGRPVEYATFLREPVDRAVSYYYFIKDLVRVDLFERHPLRDYADSVTISQFFRNPKHSNIQCRFLAGAAYHKAYPLLHRSAHFRRSMLHAAIRNLDRCRVFGIQESFDESVRRFQEAFDWSACEPGTRLSRTRKRPTLGEIDELNPAILPSLRQSHALDIQLYQQALARFNTDSAQTPVAGAEEGHLRG